jgi:ankyrin repeat protein
MEYTLSEDIKNNKDSAALYLKEKMKIPTRRELLRVIDWYYFQGNLNHVQDALNLISNKTELLSNPEELLKKANWEEEFQSGMINENIFSRLQYLVTNNRFLTLDDIRIYDLILGIHLAKVGLVAEMITQEEVNSIYSQASLEFYKSDLEMYDIAKSYVAATAYQYRGSDYLNNKIYEKAMIANQLLDRGNWGFILEKDKYSSSVSKNKTEFKKNNLSYNIPIIDDDVIVHENITNLFKTNRKSYDLVGNYFNDYKLLRYIMVDNTDEVIEHINKGYKFSDYLNHFGTSMVYEAVDKDYRILEALLEIGFDPNLKDYSGRTPLLKAVEKEEYNTIKILLDNDADPNIQTDLKLTPLGKAVKMNDSRALTLLLKNGANPDIGFIGKYSLIGYSLRNNYDFVTKLLLPNIKDMERKGYEDWSNLHIAVRNSSLETLEELLLYNINMNSLRDDNRSPAFFVKYSELDDQEERYELLYKMGADPGLAKPDGYNILLSYLNEEHYHVLEKLKEENKSEFTEVNIFSKHFKYLFDKTPNKYHVTTEYKRSGIWFLRNYGSKEQINYFLDNTPDQVITSENAYIILRSLLNRNMKEEFRRVAKRAKNFSHRTNNGWNILSVTFSDPKHYWGSEILLEYRADINIPGNKDIPIIKMLADNGEYEKVIEVIDHGAYTTTIPEIIRNIDFIDSEKERVFIKELASRDLFKEGKDSWEVHKSLLEIKEENNLLLIDNKTPQNAFLTYSNPLNFEKEYNIDFSIEDFDKGVTLVHKDKNGVNLIINLYLESTNIQTLVNGEMVDLEDVSFKFEKEKDYRININKIKNKIIVNVNDQLVMSKKMNYSPGEKLMLIVYENSLFKMRDYKINRM